VRERRALPGPARFVGHARQDEPNIGGQARQRCDQDVELLVDTVLRDAKQRVLAWIAPLRFVKHGRDPPQRDVEARLLLQSTA
jgi:hypothetical protein